jgi:hypothetical protein
MTNSIDRQYMYIVGKYQIYLSELQKQVLMVSSLKSSLILLPVLTVAQHESGTRKAKLWSVTVYNNNYPDV